MKHLIAISLIVLGSASAACSEEVLREISWAKLKQAGRLSNGELQTGQPPAPGEQLRIVNPDNRSKTFTLLAIQGPRITSSQYAVTGRVRCEGVQGKGYLEMWNYFKDGSHYFTRTMAQTGLMQGLEGSCRWRPFSLPFRATGRMGRPESLVVNVVLPGRGTVYLSSLRLVQYADNENPLAVAGAWWDGRTGGIVGGLLGSVLGCLGALIGVLGGNGKARGLVLGLMKVIFLAGVLLLATAVAALIYSQPYAVWFPLMLGGTLCSAIMGGLLPVLRSRYEQLELRQMTAIDAAVS